MSLATNPFQILTGKEKKEEEEKHKARKEDSPKEVPHMEPQSRSNNIY